MADVNLTELVLESVRKDISWKPPLLLLYEVGDQFASVPINHPLRTWWSLHRFEYLAAKDDKDNRVLINSRLLWSVGESTADDIDLDF